MNRREIISLIILIIVVCYGAYQYITREYSETRSKYILDTIVEISATSKSKNVGNEIEKVFSFIQNMESKFDEYNPESMISQINASDAEEFPMDPDLFNMLQMADSLWQITEGSFDPTIKPVWDLWHFGSDTPVIPDSLVLKEELKKVNFAALKYNETTLYKPKGMQITLGALAKGYILDQALEFMRSRPLSRGFINSRSSMSFYGYKVAPLVYIQHPRNNDDSIASFRINNQSVGTSGDYQQFYELDGKRYHHILNAKTGLPVENVFSVTVISPQAAWADGLSTALFTLSPEQAIDIVGEMNDTNCVIYYEQEGSIVSLKSEGIRQFEFSEKI